MLRLRVSDLDAYDRYLHPVREEWEVSTEDFLRYLRRESEETELMRVGKAFHTLMEKAEEGDYYDTADVGGYAFYFRGDFPLVLPPMRERFIDREYTTPVGPVLLRGKVDAEDGAGAVDYKLTSGRFDAERLARSLQWKAYLSMGAGWWFRYLVFLCRVQGDEVQVYDAHELTLWPYPEMHEEVERKVGELAQFVAAHAPDLMPKAVTQ